MAIRLAREADIPALNQLLQEILQVHHAIRPDLFRPSGQKFSSADLASIMANPETPIYVYVDQGQVVGHLFCKIGQASGSVLEPVKTFFIDDLCVAEAGRGQQIGQQLYDFAVAKAQEMGCHHLTLDVWDDNLGAKRFYERQGLKPQKTRMEVRFDEG